MPKFSKQAALEQRAEREKQFCREYVKDMNGVRAALAVGFTKNARSASVYACNLLAKPNIKAFLKKLNEERAARTLLDGDEILREIKKIATSDVRRLFDSKTGAVLPMTEWPDDVAACVSSIEVDEIYAGRGAERVLIGYTKKIKLWDKPKSQENLGRNKGLFKDVVESKNLNIPTNPVTPEEALATYNKIKNDC